MRKLDPKIIRVGDTVRIVNPIFVVRCGYPLSLEDMNKEVGEKFGNDIDRLIHKVWNGEKEDSKPFILPLSNRSKDKVYRRILNELAYVRLRAKGYGGKQRMLHTQIIERLKGLEFQVHGIICMTGEYNPSSGGYSGYYNDEYEYEPAYLIEAKAHKLLMLCAYGRADTGNWVSADESFLKIEAINVEKIPSMIETPIEYEHRMKQLEKTNGRRKYRETKTGRTP